MYMNRLCNLNRSNRAIFSIISRVDGKCINVLGVQVGVYNVIEAKQVDCKEGGGREGGRGKRGLDAG